LNQDLYKTYPIEYGLLKIDQQEKIAKKKNKGNTHRRKYLDNFLSFRSQAQVSKAFLAITLQLEMGGSQN